MQSATALARARAQQTVRPMQRTSQRSTGVRAHSTAIQLPALDGTYEGKVAFTGYANWVVPGKIMQGRYPAVEPETPALTSEGARQQLERVLAAGVTTFISLQGELPSQDQMVTEVGPCGQLKGFEPYAPVAQELVASGRVASRNLAFLHRPVVDMGVPESAVMASVLEDLVARVQAGEVLYIHCHGGRGRSGVLTCCLLATMFGMSADEAIERVARAYVTRKDGLPGSPDTPKQFDFVRKYVASLKA